MLLLDTLRLALRALLRNRTRSFLTMLGIIIGISSVIIMMSLGSSLTAVMSDTFSSLGTNTISVSGEWVRDGGNWRKLHEMDLDDLDALTEGCTRISNISPIVYSSSPLVFGNNSHSGSIEGGNETYLQLNNMDIAYGSMFDSLDVLANAKVCVIGPTVADNLFTNGENPVGQTIRCGNVPITVIGVLQHREKKFGYDFDDLVVMPYTTVMKRLSGNSYFSEIKIACADPADNEYTVAEIQQILRSIHGLAPDDPDDVNITVQSETVEQLGGILSIVVLVLSIIAGISLLVGGIGIMNIMYVTVTERTREIGLRKAIGARRGNIMLQFLTESVVLSLAGGIIGIISGLAIYALAASLIEQLPFALNVSAIVISFLVCTVVGIFFGWYPARRAANLDPIQALRYE
jgi:putative ABC transport system permease protein